ncbi:hypothetical protein [Actinomadura sp. HBU206391]|uniref:hypothetical protein n=1 Tax=Actinomadura sp. HBU206391 TaxID=2731692 RepID=UPI00164FC1A3|nr:hypothetical protein [Actinomadura sp. HBU206391]MBC6457136.1 hypothetical protein [Actinomadura sp. HBU206391]
MAVVSVLGLCAVMGVAATPAAVAEAPLPLSARYAKAVSPGATTKIEISATSWSDITSIKALLRPVGVTTVDQTVEGFELVGGTRQDGIWRSLSSVTVAQGRFTIDVELANDTRTVLHRDRGVIENGLDVVFSEFDVSPGTFDIEHATTSFRGRLVHRDAAGVEHAVAGASVGFRASGANEVSSGTDADGRFAGTAALWGTGETKVVFTGDRTYRPVSSAVIPVTLWRLPTRLTFKASPSAGVIGQPVALAGRLERQSVDGVWGALPGKLVTLELYDEDAQTSRKAGTVTTADDGTFTLRIPLPGRGSWFANFVPIEESLYNTRGYEYAYARDDGARSARYASSVTGSDAGPEPVGKGATLTARARIMRRMADGTLTGAPQSNVDLQFSADGEKWSVWTSALTDANGNVTFRTSPDRDGYWRAVVDHWNLVPSTGPADYVDVKYRTTISSFNAAPEPVRKGATITVGGTLKRYVSSWGSWSGQWVYLYFQPRGSSTWTYMAVAKTDRYGKFRKGFKASRDGSWMAKYKGATSYLPGSSGSDYVDVR